MTCKGYMKHVIRSSEERAWGFTEEEKRNAERITDMIKALMNTQGWFIKDPNYYEGYRPYEFEDFCIKFVDQLNIMTVDEFVMKEVGIKRDFINYVTDDLVDALVDQNNTLREFRMESGVTFRFRYGDEDFCNEAIIMAERRDLDNLITDRTIHERYRDGLKAPGMYFSDQMIEINPWRKDVGSVTEWMKFYMFSGGYSNIKAVAEAVEVDPDRLKDLFDNKDQIQDLSFRESFDLARALNISNDRLMKLSELQ